MRYQIPPNFSIKRARYAQREIAKKIEEKDYIKISEIKFAAGIDLAYIDNIAIGSAVIVERNTFEIIERKYSIVKVSFPYIPTLLAFREIFPAWAAIRKLENQFDILFVDGNGRLHPYRAGFACQLGLIVNKPTIGIAKKLLLGKIGSWKDNKAPIYDNNEIIGSALKTLERAKPIYVSVGHKITLRSAIKITLLFTKKKFKLPEPIRQAHIFANEIKRKV